MSEFSKDNPETHLQKQQKMLKRWSNGSVHLWGYGHSHRMMTFSVYCKNKKGLLLIACGDVQHYCGPIEMTDCSFELSSIDPEETEYTLSDPQNGFKLTCGYINTNVRHDIEMPPI